MKILVGEDHYDKSILYKKTLEYRLMKSELKTMMKILLKNYQEESEQITLNLDSIEHIQPYH